MSDWQIFGAVAVWWTFAVMVFAFLTIEGQGLVRDRIAAAVFWPLLAVLEIPAMLWRIPFKTAKAIRADLRNRNLLRKFNAWLAEQDADQ